MLIFLKKFILLLLNILLLISLRYLGSSYGFFTPYLILIFFSLLTSHAFKLNIPNIFFKSFKISTKKFLIIISSSLVIMIILNILLNSPFNYVRNIFLILTLIFSSTSEEIYIRLYLGEVFKKFNNNPLIIASLTGFVFSILHVDYQLYVYVCFFLFGMILYLIYYYTNSILFPIFIHGFYNCLFQPMVSPIRGPIAFFILLLGVIILEKYFKIFTKLKEVL